MPCKRTPRHDTLGIAATVNGHRLTVTLDTQLIAANLRNLCERGSANSAITSKRCGEVRRMLAHGNRDGA